MNFYVTFKRSRSTCVYANIILKLKLTLILLMVVILQVSATGYAQITLKEKDVPLEQIIHKIRKQIGYDFFYNGQMLSMARPVSINVNNATVEQVLELCFKDQPLTYRIEQKTIVVQYGGPGTVRSAAFVVVGKVLDEMGRPIPGASIRIKNNTNSRSHVVSNSEGEFKIIVASENDILLISYVGYVTQEVKPKLNQLPLVIRMIVAENNMKDVVITGTGITRQKNSFTGATASFSGNELKAVGNNNIIQSLRTLDPSFVLIENNIAGANPNALPNIEVRGKSSIPSSTLKDQFGSDPNQPLFILDGFETSLQTIVDLDINRVGSVTVLKDAASTALYGARASNGVVVIETLKPKQGPLRLTYTNDFRVEMPDLSGYNMMNASEKLQFEKLAGRYTTSVGPAYQVILDDLYNQHLAQIKRGIDTYWLNEPVQTGISENNSIYAEGGDQTLTYGVGINYKSQSGAMKGSGRDTWSGSINLNYNKSKVSIYNTLFVRGYTANDSPYGSFQDFVNANPYFEKDPTQRYLESTIDAQGYRLNISNPLYNALLPSESSKKNFEVQNNFRINYKMNSDLSFVAGLQLVKGTTTAVAFKSPENSDFDDVSVLQRGSYSNTKTDNFSYQGNLLLTYGKVFAEKHSVTANARAEVTNSDQRQVSFRAVGFPEGSTGNPRFAYSYAPNAAPLSYSKIYRTINATLSLNYSYDSRYLFDFSYRLDGSTSFGSNKQYSPYWSTGLGWNLKNESFAKGISWMDRLKIYGNIGVTGNQNYGNISSISVYDYNSNTNYNQFGQGVSLSTLGNANLKPQKTTQISGGVDYSLFNSRFTGYINAYQKYTDPLVVAVSLPSSTGVYSYPLNVGALKTRGIEVKTNYSVIYNKSSRIIWNVGVLGSFYRSKYGGFGNTLSGLNKDEEVNKSLQRYKDGYSPDDIWAVQSIGIDPATGREMFLTEDGQYTFDYNAANTRAVGNAKPVVEGVLSSNLMIKNFTIGVNIRYLLGGDIFNTALYNKVENITYQGIGLNQDKRALYDRWQKPGDVTQFKGISQTGFTPQSSRFVQKENTFSGESINLGYTFDEKPWLKQMGIRSLNLTAIGNDVFRLSSIKRERGTDYPFARTVSMSVRATF